GVITAMRTRFAGPQGAGAALRVFRPFESRWTGVATVPVTLGASGEATAATRLPVQAGDVLGLSKPAGPALACGVPAPGALLFHVPVNEPDAMPFTPKVTADLVPNVAATLEPDADRDGYGDETQDRCPTDPIITAGACLTDLRTGLEELRRGAIIDLGDERGIVTTIDNLAVSPAADVVLQAAVNDRVRVSSVVTSSGSCAIVPALRCELGTLAAGQRATVVLLLQGLRPGVARARMSVTSSTAERIPADNAADARLDVQRVRVLRACRVPSVRRLSLRVARRLLEAAGCAVGRVRRPAERRADLVVVAQGVRAGIKRPIGARVGLRLGAA
ncbi:MAG: PASTA domain-containing protein, partial [Solirubrobacteraceae bacterium]|nr:PASTA domain-containing protein [Solirubrobacteraceae bacterium]